MSGSSIAPQPPSDEVTVAVTTPASVDDPPRLTPLSLLLTAFLAYLLFKTQLVIILLIAGILLATAVTGPVEYLHKRHNVGRGLAVLLVYLLVLGALASLIAVLAPPVGQQANRFATNLPALIASIREQAVNNPNPIIRNAANRLFEVAGTTGAIAVPTGLALGVAQGVGGVIVTLFTIFLIAFYSSFR